MSNSLEVATNGDNTLPSIHPKNNNNAANNSSPNKNDDDDDSDIDDDEPFLIRSLSRVSSRIVGGRSSRGSPHHSLLGIVLIMMGSFSFSCMFLFVKFMQGKANSFTVAFYRAFVEIPIALYLCYDEGRGRRVRTIGGGRMDKFLGPSNVRGWLLCRGGMGGAAVLCFFYAIQHLSLPDAVTLQFTTPPFAAAFAVIFAGEQWKRLDMIGAVVCLLGVMLIAHPTWLFGAESTDDGNEDGNKDPSTSAAAIAIALLGAAFAGMAYMSVRMIGHDASANVMVLYYSCLSLPVTLIGSKGLLGDWNVWAGGSYLSGWDWCWMLLTGLTAYAGQYMTNLGLQRESAATGTLATCSQIVFTYVFELTFLHEAINIWSVAGTMLIVGFMVIVGINKMNVADENIHETVAGEPEELALLFSAERDVLPSYASTQHNE